MAQFWIIYLTETPKNHGGLWLCAKKVVLYNSMSGLGFPAQKHHPKSSLTLFLLVSLVRHNYTTEPKCLQINAKPSLWNFEFSNGKLTNILFTRPVGVMLKIFTIILFLLKPYLMLFIILIIPKIFG